MKAAVLHAPFDIRVEEVDVPTVGDREILVKVKATAICQTDLRKYTGTAQLSGPTILGHEIAGEVAEAGEHVSHVKKGDRVTLDSFTYCYICDHCRVGEYHLCSSMGSLGAAVAKSEKTPGSFAEYIKVQDLSAYPLADKASYQEAALTEPLAACLKSIVDAKVELGTSVVVIGAGPMGLMQVQLAKAAGAYPIIVSDLIEERRLKAQELGADVTVDPSKEHSTNAVLKETRGMGAKVVMVSVGGKVEATCAEQAIGMVSKRGIVNIFAGTWPQASVTLDPNSLHYNEISVSGSFGHTPEIFAKAASLISSRKVDVRPIITDNVPLAQAKTALELALSRKSLKVVMIP
jgi:L-iditol 2-dehydrogenase